MVDGREIEETNINYVDDESAIYVDHLKVHVLVRGCKFDIRDCKLTYPKIRE